MIATILGYLLSVPVDQTTLLETFGKLNLNYESFKDTPLAWAMKYGFS